MKRIDKNIVWLAVIFVVATAIVVYCMPRDSRHKYIYEENRPWSYSLLTAPFDITIYRDSATVKEMIDSIDREFVPIFRRENSVEARVQGAIKGSDALSAETKGKLSAAVSRLYADGITTPSVAALIQQGNLPEVNFNEDNENIARPTARFRSQRDAYARLDTLFLHSPEREAIQKLDLPSLLAPNIVEDKQATQVYHESLIQPVVAGIGVIQPGERIIDRGDIVTPQLFQILKTYEATLDKVTNNGRSHTANTIFGQTLFVICIFGLLYAYFILFGPVRISNPKPLMSVAILMVGFFIFTLAFSRSFTGGIYISPLAILPIVGVVFFDARTAFFIYVLEIILCSVGSSFPVEFFFTEIVAGGCVIFSLKELSRRSELLRSAAIAFAAYCLSYVAVELMSTGSGASLSWKLIGFFAINAVLISFAYILIFICEKMFGMVSVVTLVELSDINNPVLRKLSQECPGTFQHSMAVSNLASEAAHKIHANVQLVRAGALYHDIGKIDNPAFFTENQHGVNPHDALSSEQSARIIIRHVTDGVKRAEKAKLPRVICDFITQHHGRGVAKYFLIKEQQAHPDKEIDPEPFTYPGPNPQTVEASLLMMADAVEAASRSLSEHSDESIRNLVNKLIDGQVAAGLHNESPISFRDIKSIKETFISRLKTMYHARISYPEERKRKQGEGAPAHPSGEQKGDSAPQTK